MDGDFPGGKGEGARPEDRRAGLQSVTPSLKGALRRARIDDAERATAVSELRETELVRLEILAEALEPVFAQVPDHIDIFDAGVVPGAKPRLYIDMIGLVEMDEDRRTYQFIQNTRHGRVIAARSDKIDAMVEALTNYIARRLVEREKALASDTTIEDAARNLAAGPLPSTQSSTAHNVSQAQPGQQAAKPAAPGQAQPAAAGSAAERPMRHKRRPLFELLMFVAEFLGFALLLILLFGAVYFLWNLGEAWWVAKFWKTG